MCIRKLNPFLCSRQPTDNRFLSIATTAAAATTHFNVNECLGGYFLLFCGLQYFTPSFSETVIDMMLTQEYCWILSVKKIAKNDSTH